MSDWVTVCEFSLQDDLSEVAAFIRRHQLPMRISEERNRQRVASLLPQLVEPMRQLLQRWQAGEVDLAQIAVHVYDGQQNGAVKDDAVATDTATVPPGDNDPAGSETGAQQALPESPSVIPEWRFSQTPLCLVLIALCFIGWLAQFWGWDSSLMINPEKPGDLDIEHSTLAWHLSQGEYWRLWTPAFIHFSFPHALFNGLGIWILGRALEARAGTIPLLILFLVSAPVANIAQYMWSPSIKFGGMSGVVYAFVGAALIIQLKQPNWKDIPRSILWVMIVWLILCAIGVVEFFFSVGIANAAHLGGFAAGILLGLVYCVAGGTRRFAPEVDTTQRDERTF